jgi:hypothetical protein
MSKTKTRKKFSPSFQVLDAAVARYTTAPSFAALLAQINKGWIPTIKPRDARRVATEAARGAGATEQQAAAQGQAAYLATEAVASTLLFLGHSYIDDDGNCRR